MRATLVISFLLIALVGCGQKAGEQQWVQPVGMIVIPSSAKPLHRAVADRLAGEFGFPVVVQDANPICCTWLDVSVPKANPEVEGYLILHADGGTQITATSIDQLSAAVDRFISISRIRNGRREVPVGLITSFPVVQRSGDTKPAPPNSLENQSPR